jgi:ribosome biogenesis protein BMS1
LLIIIIIIVIIVVIVDNNTTTCSYGFEMETFEYLNLLQLHTSPSAGHHDAPGQVDRFKLNKTLQKTKKALKHRFWTNIYKGAKMFDFTGVINGKYPTASI